MQILTIDENGQKVAHNGCIVGNVYEPRTSEDYYIFTFNEKDYDGNLIFLAGKRISSSEHTCEIVLEPVSKELTKQLLRNLMDAAT